MDKLVGKLIAELERQNLRENTFVMFMGDNGTGGKYADQSTIGGRRLAGQKGSMLECGALVPMIINWPGITPAGKINTDLIDSTDLVPTFADLVGTKPSREILLDGQSFVPQIRGEQGNKREWIFIELGNQWYVRDTNWKLNQNGELYDMTKSPFEEILVPADSTNPDALAARKRLQAALDKLNPAGGVRDVGDGSGRHMNQEKVKGKKKKREKQEQKAADKKARQEQKAKDKEARKKKKAEEKQGAKEEKESNDSEG
jgi:arylsulfatase A